MDEDFFYPIEEDYQAEEKHKSARKRYELLDTSYITNRLIQYGEGANTQFFPAYDVALQCKKKGDVATEKQHNAMAHRLARMDIRR